MKKGFTMIEVMAVFTVAAIILLMVIPQVTSTLKKNNQMAYDSFTKNIYVACETYIESENISIPNNSVQLINITDVISKGYIKNSMINPKTNKSLEKTDLTNVKIQVNKDSDGIMTFKLIGM